MNVRMWLHPATQRNVERLRADGVLVVGPELGADGVRRIRSRTDGRASGDRRSDREGARGLCTASIAGAGSGDCSEAGMSWSLRARPSRPSIRSASWETAPPAARGMQSRDRPSAPAQKSRWSADLSPWLSRPARSWFPSSRRWRCGRRFRRRCRLTSSSAQPRWRTGGLTASLATRLRKTAARATLRLVENPDILAEVSKKTAFRPPLVIGFAAETENVAANAKAKLKRKGCDWIVANSVAEGTSTFGGETNEVS